MRLNLTESEKSTLRTIFVPPLLFLGMGIGLAIIFNIISALVGEGTAFAVTTLTGIGALGGVITEIIKRLES
jgi:hypothetical protein